MTRTISNAGLWRLAIAGFLLAFPLDGRAQTQPPAVQRGAGFTYSEYYPAPDHTQMKLLLTGAEGRSEGNNRLRVTDAKVQSFRKSGELEMTLEAPDCTYDRSRNAATSPGRLQMQTGDGRFSVSGEGFLWQHAESYLTISNDVRSLIQRTPTNAAPAEAKPPLTITSRRFEFDLTNRVGVYSGQVHGEDPEMEFTCGKLTASGSTNAQSFDLLVAEEAAEIVSHAREFHAVTDRAVYRRADESLDLLGHAAWKQTNQEGRAGRFSIRRRERLYEAHDNVELRLPRESLGLGGFFLPATNAPTGQATNSSPLVSLFADHFLSRSNVTIAEGSVRVVDATNELTCDKLTVLSATATAPAEMATAEGNVVMTLGHADRRIRAGRAVYTKLDGLMVFTEKPDWTLEQTEGRADRLTIQNPGGALHAEGNVATKISLAAQRGSFLKLFPGSENTNRGPQVIEVFARELRAKEREVSFLGDAHAHESPISGGEPRLRSDAFVLSFATNAQRLEMIEARENVIYEQGIPGVTNGASVYRKLTTRRLAAQADPSTGEMSGLTAEGDVQVEQFGDLAKGGRATYTAATEVLELTEQPSLQTPQLLITDARTLVWDKALSRFVATGPYKIKVPGEALKQGIKGRGEALKKTAAKPEKAVSQ